MSTNIRLKPKRASDTVQEKYERKGARFPWLHPLEKPIVKGPAKFTRLYHIRKTSSRAEGPYRNPTVSNENHFRNLKHEALKDDFLDNVPADTKTFPKTQYSHAFAKEAKFREEHFSEAPTTTEPLRELVDIRNPLNHSVSTITSIHSLRSMPFYHIAKGQSVQTEIVHEKSSVELTNGANTLSSESAADLLEIVMYRKGYRDKFKENPDLTTLVHELEDENSNFQSLVEDGVKSVVRDILAEAKARGWKPGTFENSAYPNPVHLAFVQSNNSFNQIPMAFARILEEYGQGYLVMDPSFTKGNTEKRTGTTNQYRLFNQPVFNGKAQPDTYYAILDDVMTTGATLMNLGGKIAAQGGIVSSYHVLSSAGSSLDMVPTKALKYIRRGEQQVALEKELDTADKILSKLESSPPFTPLLQEVTEQYHRSKKEIEKRLDGKTTEPSYEHVLGSILHRKGYDTLQKALSKKLGLTFLTMNYHELKTINALLEYIDGSPSKHVFTEYAPYILADIISRPKFEGNLLEPKKGGTTIGATTLKDLIIEYKKSHDDTTIRGLPSKLLKQFKSL